MFSRLVAGGTKPAPRRSSSSFARSIVKIPDSCFFSANSSNLDARLATGAFMASAMTIQVMGRYSGGGVSPSGSKIDLPNSFARLRKAGIDS